MYGVSRARGKRLETGLLKKDPSGKFTGFADRIGDQIDALSCKCQKNGTPADCNSGGEGATDCSVSASGGAATISGAGSCDVTCGEGYFACCNF